MGPVLEASRVVGRRLAEDDTAVQVVEVDSHEFVHSSVALRGSLHLRMCGLFVFECWGHRFGPVPMRRILSR